MKAVIRAIELKGFLFLTIVDVYVKAAGYCYNKCVTGLVDPLNRKGHMVLTLDETQISPVIGYLW